MNKSRAIAVVARTSMALDYADTSDAEEFENYTVYVTATTVGFGETALKAVENGLSEGTIEWPQSDKPLSSDDVLSIIRHGGMLTFHTTPHGVLITDNN